MKEIYYYEYSDDQITWHEGEPSFSLAVCVDNAQRQPYTWRIKQSKLASDWKEVPNKEIRQSKTFLKLIYGILPNDQTSTN